MAQRTGAFAILTPDARNTFLRTALETVNTRVWTRSNGQTFGPYPHAWERQDNEEADALLANIVLPQTASCADLSAILAPLACHPAIAQAISRIDRLRRVAGKMDFAAAQVTEFVRQALFATERVWASCGSGRISP